jgi:hypothetical protein
MSPARKSSGVTPAYIKIPFNRGNTWSCRCPLFGGLNWPLDLDASLTALGQDKTGTLTQNKMHVQDVAFLDARFEVTKFGDRFACRDEDVLQNLRQIPAIGALCNSASFAGTSENSSDVIGDATGMSCFAL